MNSLPPLVYNLRSICIRLKVSRTTEYDKEVYLSRRGEMLGRFEKRGILVMAESSYLGFERGKN